MRAICSAKLYIKEPTRDFDTWCREHLVFANPEYAKLEKMGKWTGNTKKEIVLFERVGNDLILPFGCLRDVWDNFKTEFESFEVGKGLSVMYGLKPFGSHIELYDYQKRVVDNALKKKNGVIIMPCGSGKTQTALEIVARLRCRTLWLTHTQDLLRQSMDRAKSCFYGLDDEDYGTITEGKVNIGEIITFATVQTMSNIVLDDYKDLWDCIIVDECHKCIGTPTNVMMFYKVLSKLSARFKIGLTATDKRADGLERCMFALLGNVIDEVTKEEVAHTTCPVQVKMIETFFTPKEEDITASDGTIVYSKLIDAIVNDEGRNKLIVNDVEQMDGSCLILTDRLVHIDNLMTLFANSELRVAGLKGSSGSIAEKTRRKKILKELNDGECDVVIATYKLAKEGLDIPNLKYLVLATPQKDYTTVVQSVGRVGRKSEGKECGTVIDYVDDFGLLWGYMKKRKAIYKKNDYKIVDIY